MVSTLMYRHQGKQDVYYNLHSFLGSSRADYRLSSDDRGGSSKGGYRGGRDDRNSDKYHGSRESRDRHRDDRYGVITLIEYYRSACSKGGNGGYNYAHDYSMIAYCCIL